MKISLRAGVEGMYWSGGAITEVPELFRKAFEPLKTCDDAVIAMATGDVMEREARVVMKMREDAAEILARELARMITTEMQKSDTHNGYIKEQ